MKRATKIATTASIVAQGPAGIRRVLASLAVVVLLGVLMLAALLGFGAWSASHSAAGDPLPCPPAKVAIAYSTRDVPLPLREAVTEALSASGRTAAQSGWDAGATRDLVVVWSPGVNTRVSGSNPVKITLGSVPAAAEVRAALGARLGACDASPSASASAHDTPPAQDPQDTGHGTGEAWERGVDLTGSVGVVVAVWWFAGPQIVRGVWGLFWLLRLGVRLAQRAGYRRRLAQGIGGAIYPEPVSPGQRWHERPEALRDRTTFRAQIAQGESARRSALRAAIKAERLAGTGIGPASLWRSVYRVPKGQQESTEV